MKLSHWPRAAVAVLLGGLFSALSAGLGCDDSNVDSPFGPRPQSEAGSDASTRVNDAGDTASPDGGEQLGKPCLDDAQCDDGIDCTFDECVAGPDRCRSLPDHSKCADEIY